MSKDKDCMYCNPDERQSSLMIKICDLAVSELFFFKEQSHPGRSIVAYKDHAKEIFNLPPADQAAFIADVARAAQAITAVYHCDKINYGAFGDRKPSHLHMHLVPKYEDQFEWGGVFAMNPQTVYLTEEDYAAAIEKIKQAL